MKNLILLNRLGFNPDLTTRQSRVDSVSIASRYRVLAILLLFFTIGSGNAWAAEYAHTFNTSTQSLNTTTGEGTITVADNHPLTMTVSKNGGSNFASYAPYRLYSKNKLTISANDGYEITSVVVNFNSYQALTVATDAPKYSYTTTSPYTFTPQNSNSQASSCSTVSFTNGQSSQAKITSVTIIYQATPSGCTGTKLGTPSVTATPSNGQVQLSWPNVSNASSYQLKWNGGDWATATSPVTKTGLTNGTAYTYQVKAIGNGSTYCDGDASAEASATPNVYYTVTWNNNGSEYTTTQVVSGQRPTFPEAPSSCDAGEGASTTFYGWATNTWSGKAATLEDSKLSGITIYTSAASMPTVTGNGVVYHAVFCKGGAGSEVLNEEFDNNSSSDASNAITTSTFSKFSGETSKAYKSKYGGIKLGSGSSAGYITSKSLDLSEAFTVSIDACKYGSDGGNINVTVGSTTKTISNSELGAAGTFNTYELSFDAATSTSTVKIETSSLRAYIDNVVVTRKGATSNYLTNCCTQLGTINGSICRT